MEELYNINNVAAQSTYFKTKVSKSKDTGIFLDTGAIQYIGKKTGVNFVIYKEDCIAALSNILVSLPLHISPAGEPSLVSNQVELYEEFSKVLLKFFGEKEKATYGPFDLSTTTADRTYVYKLDHPSGFNIRKFLVADHSQIVLKRNEDGTIDFRFKTNKTDNGYSTHSLNYNYITPSNYEGDLKPVILYGPPGTGKTYTMQKDYLSKYDELQRYITTFHQSFSYEEFVEGLKPELNGEEISYHIEKGIFFQACERAAITAGYCSLSECIQDSKENRQNMFDKAIKEKRTVLLCIDEINRGNVASIFGDLISLIEPSKRLGGELEMMVKLPYSKENFGVPSNLMIVGTMNTADRSIQLLDSALRRRFKFKELLPQYDNFEKEEAKQILKNINARVRCLLNKDNQIGHSYLMKAKSYSKILSIMVNNIIPLLEEYFYNDIDKVRFVIGDKEKSDNFFFVEDEEAKKAHTLFTNGDIDEEDREFYTLNPDIAEAIKDENEEECKKYLEALLKADGE